MIISSVPLLLLIHNSSLLHPCAIPHCAPAPASSCPRNSRLLLLHPSPARRRCAASPDPPPSDPAVPMARQSWRCSASPSSAASCVTPPPHPHVPLPAAHSCLLHAACALRASRRLTTLPPLRDRRAVDTHSFHSRKQQLAGSPDRAPRARGRSASSWSASAADGRPLPGAAAARPRAGPTRWS